jgi:hypothetical protein
LNRGSSSTSAGIIAAVTVRGSPTTSAACSPNAATKSAG